MDEEGAGGAGPGEGDDMAAHLVALELVAAAAGTAGWRLSRWARARRMAVEASLGVSEGPEGRLIFRLTLTDVARTGPEVRSVGVEFREPGPSGREFCTWRWGQGPFRMDPAGVRCLSADHFASPEWGPCAVSARAVVTTGDGRTYRSPEIAVARGQADAESPALSRSLP
jgi:hypothetical protein